MKNVYACPHCEAVLNPSVKILLVVSYERKRGMILLSPQPGNFKFVCDGIIEETLKAGRKVDFSCPICSTDLTSKTNNNFAELHMLNVGNTPKLVEFSRIFGKHATFIIDDEEITSFGEDVKSGDAVNFFGS